MHQFFRKKNIQILEIQKIELRTKKFPSPRDPKSEFSDFRDRCTNFFIYFLKKLVHLSLKSENSDLGSLGQGNFFVLNSIFCISKIWIFFLSKNIWCTCPSKFFSCKQCTFESLLLYWNLRSLAIIVLELIIPFMFTSGVKFGEVAETFHLTTETSFSVAYPCVSVSDHLIHFWKKVICPRDQPRKSCLGFFGVYLDIPKDIF